MIDAGGDDRAAHLPQIVCADAGQFVQPCAKLSPEGKVRCGYRLKAEVERLSHRYAQAEQVHVAVLP